MSLNLKNIVGFMYYIIPCWNGQHRNGIEKSDRHPESPNYFFHKNHHNIVLCLAFNPLRMHP